MKSSGMLLWVPSSLTLVSYENSTFAKLKEPRALLIIEDNGSHYKVLYEGESWMAPKASTYIVGDENAS